MNHRSKGKTLGRTAAPRKALMRSLAIGLITHEKIVTTEAKAKAIRPVLEKMVTIAKTDAKDTLSARRNLISKLGNIEAAKKLLEEIAPKYKTRNGGYLRITKVAPRQGDAARMAQIEFVK